VATSSVSFSRALIKAATAVPLAALLVFTAAGAPAAAAEPEVGLGVLESYAVLGGETVTNDGPSLITGSLAVSPGSAVTGFPPGLLNGGVQHAADVEAAAARAAFTTAYGDAAGRSPSVVGLTELANMNLVPGVYSGGALLLSGTLTLTGGADDVFIFQATSSLITASSSVVSLIGGVSSCNVYWQVASSATLGSNSIFVGTVLAGASITANSTAFIRGRLLGGTGQVELHNNVIVRPSGCDGTLEDDVNGDGVVDAGDGDTNGDGDVDDAEAAAHVAAGVAAAAAAATQAAADAAAAAAAAEAATTAATQAAAAAQAAADAAAAATGAEAAAAAAIAAQAALDAAAATAAANAAAIVAAQAAAASAAAAEAVATATAAANAAAAAAAAIAAAEAAAEEAAAQAAADVAASRAGAAARAAAAAARADERNSVASTGSLASTGSSPMVLVWPAVGLMLLGIPLVLVRRRAALSRQR
jgi:hypothetical protein